MTKIPFDLKLKLKKKGSLSLSEYINFCLYNPKRGYYRTQNSVGKDFTTSPEISQLFGECIGIFFLNSINNFFEKNEISFFELGPGQGSLSKDIIRVLNYKKHLKKKFHLIEISDKLILRQKKKLKDEIVKNKIFWRKNINLSKINTPIFFYCNEFFDALPIDQFKKINNNWHEKLIFMRKDGKLSSYYKRTSKKIPMYYHYLKNDSVIEISKSYEKYLKKIFQYLEKFGGVFVIFDYGPYNKSFINTLQGIYNKNKCSIFEYPCESDITHHLDFNFIIELSKEFRVKHIGPISQREFLIKNGILERFKILVNSNNLNKYGSLKKELDRLINPKEMGEIFKCLIFSNKNIKKILNYE